MISEVCLETGEAVGAAGEPACFNRRCIACGPDNSRGLRLAFHVTANGVSTTWGPTEDWASYPGTVHGGIVTTVLDEAMSKAVIASGIQAYTMELAVRFHRRVKPGEWYWVEARVIEKRKRKIATEARLFSEGGITHAHAWATFLQDRAE